MPPVTIGGRLATWNTRSARSHRSASMLCQLDANLLLYSAQRFKTCYVSLAFLHFLDDVLRQPRSNAPLVRTMKNYTWPRTSLLSDRRPTGKQQPRVTHVRALHLKTLMLQKYKPNKPQLIATLPPEYVVSLATQLVIQNIHTICR